MEAPKLNFVIIGAHKGGSTSLAMTLAGHPSVRMMEGESDVFETPNLTDSALYERLSQELPVAHSCHQVGMKRPMLLSRPEIPALLYKHFPHARLILTVRDPISRFRSALNQGRAFGLLSRTTVENLTLSEMQTSPNPLIRNLLECGRYGSHLSRFLNYFPASQVKVVTLEETYRSPKTVFSELTDFLSLERSELPPYRNFNPGLYHPVVRAASRFSLKWHENRHHRDSLKGRWYFLLRKITLQGLAPRFKNTPSPLPEELRKNLVDYFTPEVERLQRLTRLDVSSWPNFSAMGKDRYH